MRFVTWGRKLPGPYHQLSKGMVPWFYNCCVCCGGFGSLFFREAFFLGTKVSKCPSFDSCHGNMCEGKRIYGS